MMSFICEQIQPQIRRAGLQRPAVIRNNHQPRARRAFGTPQLSLFAQRAGKSRQKKVGKCTSLSNWMLPIHIGQ